MAVEEFKMVLPMPDSSVEKSTTFDIACALLRDRVIATAAQEGDVVDGSFKLEILRTGKFNPVDYGIPETVSGCALLIFTVDVEKPDE